MRRPSDPCDDSSTHATTHRPMRRLIDPCDDSSTHTTHQPTRPPSTHATTQRPT
ncbi:MAG: hypothetical protein BYD32DRAFT_428093 [Podila humilis]|nr:MAG: hypothetical protein BYD32DRAFT_428093 [Podila humilis]